MILIIDNNDSFTYNISNQISLLTDEHVRIVNHAEVSPEEVERYSHVIFSPGPSLPEEYPVMKQILDRYSGKLPILGICLGHQAICTYFGFRLYNLERVYHGERTHIVTDRNSVLFHGMEETYVGRYHSWAVTAAGESPLSVTATDADGVIMAVENAAMKIFGVQFHPESYISDDGNVILKNFLNVK